MNKKALQTLEFNKITELLSQKAITPKGKATCINLEPGTSLEQVTLWQRETTEAVSCILQKGSLPLGGFKDITESVKRAGVMGVLSVAELLHVADFLYVCKKIIAYSKYEGKEKRYELLDNRFQRLVSVNELEKEISRCIVNEAEVADDASPALYEIRRSIKTSKDRIKDTLNSIIHSQTYKSMLQDTVITMRNDRYCVPVKQEYRGSFQGMVHDESSSGATVFIEPISVVTLNNKIKELLSKEKIEIEKILRQLSLMVYENEGVLSENFEILTELDFIFAKGELSLSINGTEPIFNSHGYINIINGRHPLLNKDTVVPINIYLGDVFSLLLITGPNTGGKTVALKTTGLFTIMGLSGLHISAREKSQLAMFTEVFADIGDEQSIAQSLSTFSGHMSNIVKILDQADSDSLVLLDELGAGTDPTEGAALAISILQHLHARDVRTLVTTHYSELKLYALSTEGVENASCEFDVETLRPTYKLLIGIPGKSNAFAISKKLGLAEDIIEEARKSIAKGAVRFEDVLTDLEISRKTVIIEQEKAERFRAEAYKLKQELDSQKVKLEQQKEKILLAAKEEAKRIVQEANLNADALVKEISKKAREGAALHEVDESRQKLRSALSTITEELSSADKEKNRRPAPPKSLNKGDRVFIYSLNQKGTVLKDMHEGDNEAFVGVGIMKINVKRSDLSIDKSEEVITVSKMPLSHSVKATKSISIKPELDLRGMMVSESLETLDKYLDDAYLSGLSQVTIIHGKGTGALRTAVTTHLKGHSHVESSRMGKFGEGEMGVTIITLR